MEFGHCSDEGWLAQLTEGLGQFFVYFLHCSKFYTLPIYYLGNAISKTVSLSSLAHLLPVLVNFDSP